MRSSILGAIPVLTLATVVLAQDQDERDPDEIVAEPALVSVGRKHASQDELGLYRRSEDGSLRLLWGGEPYDARWLVDRTILVVDRWGGRVVWLDPLGDVLFVNENLDEPVDVERAADGTIVVVEKERGRVIGFDPRTGEVRWTRSGYRNPFDAATLPEGELLVADSDGNRVVKLDAEGKILWQYRGMSFPNAVEPLEDGGVLVTNWSGGEVCELDEHGKERWRVSVGGTLYSAERMPDGLTVVCDGGGRRVLFLGERGVVLKTERLAKGCVDYETILEL